MIEFFECTVKYNAMSEDGILRRLTELYLLDAVTFTEVEQRIYEKLAPQMNDSSDFVVHKIQRSAISEVINDKTKDDGAYFRAKIAFVSYNDAGKKRLIPHVMLVYAGTVAEANDTISDIMDKAFSAEYEIKAIIETSILEVFKYKIDSSELAG